MLILHRNQKKHRVHPDNMVMITIWHTIKKPDNNELTNETPVS